MLDFTSDFKKMIPLSKNGEVNQIRTDRACKNNSTISLAFKSKHGIIF
jgi:hypothetical protein